MANDAPKIRIGIGNKVVDQIIVSLSVAVLLVLLIWTIFNINALGFFVIVSAGTAFQVSRKLSFSYVSFEHGNFIIENIANKRTVLDARSFTRVSKEQLTFPFSNVIRVHFENGKSYKVLAGLRRWDELEAEIKSVVRPHLGGEHH